jgi:hypothetical protein
MRGIKRIRLTRHVREKVEVVVEFKNDMQQDTALWESLFNRALEKGKKISSHDTYNVSNQYGYVHPPNEKVDFRVLDGHFVGP